MASAKDIVTGFIQTAFDRNSTWEDIEKFANGVGKYSHPILDTPTIRDLYGLYHIPRSSLLS